MPLKSVLEKTVKKARTKIDSIKADLKNYHSTVRPRLTTEDLINAESEFGRLIFGPIPAGHRREFFEHKKNVWIWHESWPNQFGDIEQMTIRYEVRPNGVFKRSSGGIYQKIEATCNPT